MVSDRAGRFVRQPAGYRAFVPAPIPPSPDLQYDAELIRLLDRASSAVGRLDGFALQLPNPDFFVAMYVRREAVLSSQIEGTQSTLDDVLKFELDPRMADVPDDVTEVVNYVRAMNQGLERLSELPLSLRLLREIHAELLSSGRGAEKQPGEFRTSQNWIGPGGGGLQQAAYIPPAPGDMMTALDNLERYLHEETDLPPLIHVGIAHAQFETIHPFLDGNGRVGRLLITFLLVLRDILHRPLLYLSFYLKRHRAEYYDRLMAIRLNGDWEGWIKFFLKGVASTAEEATSTARSIVRLREVQRTLVDSAGLGVNGFRLIDVLFDRPVIDVSFVSKALGIAYGTANSLVRRAEDLGTLVETTGGQRNRRFRFGPYLQLFAGDSSETSTAEQSPVQRTGN